MFSTLFVAIGGQLDQRYFTGLSGRFLTADPAGSGANHYGYAGGDPANANDPEGLALIYVTGTGENNPAWTQPGNPMYEEVRAYFGENDDNCIAVFNWPGSAASTVSGAPMIAAGPELDELIELVLGRCPGQPLNLVGYSHGGNVIVNYLNQPYANYVSNVVTLGTPSRADIYLSNEAFGRFGKFCAGSLDNDAVQFGGAHPAQLAE